MQFFILDFIKLLKPYNKCLYQLTVAVSESVPPNGPATMLTAVILNTIIPLPSAFTCRNGSSLFMVWPAITFSWPWVYECECVSVSVWVWVCECVNVSVSVCVCVWECVRVWECECECVNVSVSVWIWGWCMLICVQRQGSSNVLSYNYHLIIALIQDWN